MSNAPRRPRPTTELLHADRARGTPFGAIHEPVQASVQYGFDRVEDLIGVFQGTLKNAFVYARQGTPTSAALEARLARMEEGLGAICFATGMGAISALILTLLRAGDHVVCSRFVFGNTFSFLGTLAGLGVETTYVDAASVDAVRAAIRPSTRLVFVETIANPGTQVPDLAAIGQLCAERRVLYVVDNTVTSPALFRPRAVGAGVIVHSLTKTIAGHGAALGGALVFTDRFDWAAYPNIFAAYRSTEPAQQGLQQVRKKGLRDMGAALSAEHAHLIALGTETLGLRVERCSATAQALARWLEAHPKIASVRYPMLESHPQHRIARELFGGRGSWLLSFELRDTAALTETLNRLRIPVKATGLGDNRSLVIPVAPTIFWEAGAAARADMGIADGLIRFSVGLEDAADLIADWEQALG